MINHWTETIYQLLARASTDLPIDVEDALRQGLRRETPGSNAAIALGTIIENVELARRVARPLCQDTGTLLFWVTAGKGLRLAMLRTAAEQAIRQATAAGILRQNSVDSVTGVNSGNNLGPGSPSIHWEEGEGAETRLSVMLKGGGCENVGTQLSLPDLELGIGRNLAGVRRAILEAVVRAQGQGCAPGVLGVCIGGDRSSSYAESKRQLLRRLGEQNPIPELAELEREALAEANELGIGPMGFGGKTTLLGVQIGRLNRLPASYFVTVSYMCWCYRRYTIAIDREGCLARWL